MNRLYCLRSLLCLISVLVVASCSLTSRLHKKNAIVELTQPNREPVKDTVASVMPGFITFKDKDGVEKIVTEAALDTVSGEYLTTVNLGEVMVVAKSKNIPERNGKIDIGFIVTVPGVLINKKWSVVLSPELMKADTILKLNDLVLSGKKFRRQQLKDYQKYEKFLKSIIPDTADFRKNYVDMAGVTKYMERKSIQETKNLEKEIKRELSHISLSGNNKKKQRLLAERMNIIRKAKTGPKVYDSKKVQVIHTDDERKDDKSSIEDVTAYLMNLPVKESQEKQPDKRTNVISFTSKDSADVVERFVQKDKLTKNEKKKMQKEQKYSEMVRHPYNEDARIDSIVSTGKTFRYFYSQSVPADEYTKKMMLTLTGRVEAIDNSTFQLPLTDTLTYFVSSMVQFLDKAPRFRKKIVERRAEANMSAYITFPVGEDGVDESLGNNEQEINKINDIIKRLTWSSEFEIDSIAVTASSSPEGTWKSNELLAKKRARALKKYFSDKLDDKEGIDTLLRARWIAEDWKKLSGLIAADEQITNKNQILDIINGTPDPDEKERLIRKRYPEEYNYLKNNIYPELRVVDFKFNLHRSGMVKDTIHTTEPDTVYANALEMLEERKYTQALSILIDYNDFNTAICYMSLGYDEMAYKILESGEETADSEYLMSILASRMNRPEEAVRRYLHSVEMDESKAWRGLLDPEINRLIKKYNLNKE